MRKGHLGLFIILQVIQPSAEQLSKIVQCRAGPGFGFRNVDSNRSSGS